jgi:hypothetical protein
MELSADAGSFKGLTVPLWPLAKSQKMRWLFIALALMLAQGLRGASLVVNFSPLSVPTNIDLSADGVLGWLHWGTDSATSFDQKSPVTNLISDFTQLGSNPLQQETSLGIGYSWTNGVPTASAVNSTTAVSVNGLNDGFHVQVLAGTNQMQLKLYAGSYLARGKLEARLSDSSTPGVTNILMDATSGETNGLYVIDFAAASPGQTLSLQFSAATNYDAVNARVLLHSAALRPPPNQLPLLSITSPTNEGSFAFGSNIQLIANAIDNDGSIVKIEFFNSDVKLGETTTNFFIWTNPPVGEHSITAVATDNSGETNSSDSITLYVYSNLGLLSAAEATPGAAIDLAAEGLTDWAHWGLFTAGSFDHKAGVAPQISNYSSLESDAFNYSDNLEGYSWAGGTPTAIANDTHTGVYFAGLGNGFEITVDADTTVKTLKLYVGAYAARGRLQAFLSDFSSPIYFDSSLENTGNGPSAVYTISFRASSPNQSLILRYKVIQVFDPFGNVTLQAATLVGANNPPFVSIITPTNQTVVTGPVNITIEANAFDTGGAIDKVEFYQGLTKLGESTNEPYVFVWTNVPAGNYSLTARATDNQNATFTSSPVNLYVVNAGGSLSGSFAQSPATLDLSAEGTLDWGHWGVSRFNSFNHKSGGNQISDVTIVANGNPSRYADNAVSFSWTNGTPVLATNNTTTGIFVEGVGNGFQMSIPADTKPKRLKVYLGLFAAHGHFEASLSDFSAAPYIENSLTNLFGNSYRTYTIDFSAASSNKFLIVKYTASELFDPDFGNVTWQAATLHFPIITLLSPQKSGDQFSFVVRSELSKMHDVEYCDSLPGPWFTLTNFPGTGADVLIVDPGPVVGTRFYRVHTE